MLAAGRWHAHEVTPEGLVAGPPNIVMIIADDLNTRIAPYVDSTLVVHTPNLDRLAESGVRFTRAYAQYPVCGPSRASIMSGLYPESNGVTGNAFDTGNHRLATPELADHPTMARFLKDNGYYTARVSKIFHVGVPGGIERGETGSDDPDSWDFAVDIMAPETMSPGRLERLSRGQHYGSNFARMILEDGQESTQADVLAADQAISILETRLRPLPSGATNRTRVKPDAPLFLALGFVRPHVPLIAPARHFDRYPEDKAPLPAVPDSDLEDVPEQAARMSNANRFGMTLEQQRQAVAAYHASVSFMDEQVGRVLDALERVGAADNTVIIFLSDHGFNLGEHSSWQKLSLWEESVRVPLIISQPGGLRGASDEIVELIDLYPTVAGLAGLEKSAPGILQGTDMLSDSDESGEAYTITSAEGGSLRTERWRYNRWGESAGLGNEELYDHANDPGEFTNLANDPAHRATLVELRTRFNEVRSNAQGFRSALSKAPD
ncbi:MAG: sulfatase [Rhodothermales bacterium]|nr:sulfatase [Rhodothermales bacterium]